MNNFNMVLLTFSLLISNAHGQWEILNEGGNFKSIDFVNNDIGWIAGRETLLKTEDGGHSWNWVSSDSVWNFDKIDFENETVGWAIDDRIIKKTEDGGLTWFVQAQVSLGYLFDLYVVNESVVFAVGRSDGGPLDDVGLIFKTTDGGVTWTESILYVGNYSTSFHTVRFIDNEIGIVVGIYHEDDLHPTVVYRTFDGGQTWAEQLIPEFSAMSDFQFINDSTGYFLAGDDNEDHILCKTTNMCSSWTIITQRTFPIHSYHYLNIDTVFAVMEDSISSNIKRSIDGGLTWENRQLVRGVGKIYFKEDNVGFMVESSRGRGRGEYLWKSNDRGEDWLIRKLDYPLKDVYFFDNNKGLFVGGRLTFAHGGFAFFCGDLYTTYDGAKTWRHEFRTNRKLTSCYFVNDNLGFISAQDIIFKTTDGGDNWIMVYENNPDTTGYSFWGNNLVLFDENIGWAVGRYMVGDWDTTGAAILGTFDSGQNWDLVWTYPDTGEYAYELHSIHAVGTTAWAAGEFGQMVKYTSQNQWQAITSVTDLSLREVFFSDENHGWIAGGYFDDENVFLKLFKTNDAGASWQEIPDFDYQINDMFFEDSLHGWAVGNDTSDHGVILETTDGGNNWMLQADGLAAPLNALHFKDGYGWAVGKKGLILRTDGGASWVDQNSGTTYPTAFKLFQNYPNPFNPTTNIEFDLPQASKVTLKIYNILGEEVITLVSGRLSAGSYAYEWDARGYASGVYYYKIDVGRVAATKKLVLLK